MKTKSFVSVLFVLTLAVILPNANAHTEIFTASLSGPNENPANTSLGTGSATVTLDLDLFTMRVEITFSNLEGLTTASHIHAPTFVPLDGTAGVATQVPSFESFPLGVSDGSYDHTFDLSLASTYNPAFITSSGGTVSLASNALIFALEQGKAYLNVHTSAFLGGEIRGFLVPEPATIALLGLSLTTGVLLARRRPQQSS